MSILLLVLGIILFLSLVVAHEWGHFIMARRGGVDIQEFGIGFPPRLFKKQIKSGWIFTINLLPLGGFVRLKGEHDIDSEPGSLGAASVGTKASIMIAGVVVNFLLAYMLFLLLAFVGMPQLIDNQFTIKRDTTYTQYAHKYLVAAEVETGSPGAMAGIRQNDVLRELIAPSHTYMLVNTNELPALTRQLAGDSVTIVYRHSLNGPDIRRVVTLRSSQEVATAHAAGRQTGYLGVGITQDQQGISIVRSTWSAPIVAAGVMKQFTVLTFSGLGKAIAGLSGIVAGELTGNTHARQAAQTQASSQVAGPIGVFFVLKYGATLGIKFVLMIVAVISLTLAIMNILPIPALDGGRLWLMLVTRAFRRPLSPHREEVINTAGFAFLVSLVILVTIIDVRRFF